MQKAAQQETRCRKYLDCMCAALRFLANYSVVQAKLPDMRASCLASADALQSLRTSGGFREFTLRIAPNWVLPLDPTAVSGLPALTYLVFGADIAVSKGPQVLQSIVATIVLEATKDIGVDRARMVHAERLKGGNQVVIRRFHFDYDTARSTDDHPRSHIQYGGKFQGVGAPVADARYSLFSSLDCPRIPFAPFDLVITLDFLLHQFDTPLRTMVQEPEWLSLLRKSESLWLTGYHAEVSRYLNSTDRKEGLYARLCRPVDWTA